MMNAASELTYNDDDNHINNENNSNNNDSNNNNNNRGRSSSNIRNTKTRAADISACVSQEDRLGNKSRGLSQGCWPSPGLTWDREWNRNLARAIIERVTTPSVLLLTPRSRTSHCR